MRICKEEWVGGFPNKYFKYLSWKRERGEGEGRCRKTAVGEDGKGSYNSKNVNTIVCYHMDEWILDNFMVCERNSFFPNYLVNPKKMGFCLLRKSYYRRKIFTL